MEYRVGVEANQSVIYVVLPLLRSTCGRVDCLGERVLFLFHLWRFLVISFFFKRTDNAI